MRRMFYAEVRPAMCHSRFRLRLRISWWSLPQRLSGRDGPLVHGAGPARSLPARASQAVPRAHTPPFAGLRRRAPARRTRPSARPGSRLKRIRLPQGSHFGPVTVCDCDRLPFGDSHRLCELVVDDAIRCQPGAPGHILWRQPDHCDMRARAEQAHRADGASAVSCEDRMM